MRRHYFLFVLIIQSFFFLPDGHAQIYLDVFITHHKGVDQGLVLTSEFQSLEKVMGKDRRVLELRNGIRLEVWAEFIDKKNEEDVGPSSLVKVNGVLFGPRMERWLEFRGEEHYTLLGQALERSYSDANSQVVDIKVVPYL